MWRRELHAIGQVRQRSDGCHEEAVRIALRVSNLRQGSSDAFQSTVARRAALDTGVWRNGRVGLSMQLTRDLLYPNSVRKSAR
ncbi:hypothetical protein DF3PB_70014 [uncultured Defluviicoccus sp.]|uniref:Uncharacterized protein n=1 Tax=metagenome TaxID=256318 RepID=A0A380TKC1_9ZZZZ|nr:hypothetical protein DF3PB_70014 [uncultured Defluviicoccus sp.]